MKRWQNVDIRVKAEPGASIKLAQGARQGEGSPVVLAQRRMQSLSETGINNSTTIVLFPAGFTQAASIFAGLVTKKSDHK